MTSDPFLLSTSRPGHGEAHVALLPPSRAGFRTLNFTYPLKLIASSPHILQPPHENGSEAYGSIPRPSNVPLLFMLTYGGGLLPTDSISLDVTLEASTRLTLATQGSTKVFPSDPKNASTTGRSSLKPTPVVRNAASQYLRVKLGPHSALLLCPDPVQPFRGSHYSQVQIFEADAGASLGLLDWVTSGRPARDEIWEAGSWTGRNEIWRASVDTNVDPRLLLRDAVYLEGGPGGVGQRTLREEFKGVFGTLILLGPVFSSMAKFFMSEYAQQPKVGGYNWDDDETAQAAPSELENWRKDRLLQEKSNDVLWTAAKARGLVVVKFTAKEAEGAKAWLNSMFQQDGTIEREFGSGGLLSVR